MRCSKCGYDGTGNIPGGTCIKCGTRLNANGSAPVSSLTRIHRHSVNDSQLRPTMIGMKAPEDKNLRATRIVGASESKYPLKQTVIQGAVPKMGGQMKSTVVQSMNASIASSSLPVDDSGELACPKCGYPLADRYMSCPNCGADFSGGSEEEPVDEKNIQGNEDHPTALKSSSKKECKEKHKDDSLAQGTMGLSALKEEESSAELICTCENCGEEISATFRFCPKCGNEIHQQTIRGFRHKKKKEEIAEVIEPIIKTEFKLTIIPEEDEGIEPVTNHFDGTEIKLNRKNTEPDNRTITTKEQAVVFLDHGKWYIENRSDFGSTSILANRKMEIQNGDVIMLGDRRFKFETEESEQV